jgi:DNA-binding CsgD family transcriptional regulator
MENNNHQPIFNATTALLRRSGFHHAPRPVKDVTVRPLCVACMSKTCAHFEPVAPKLSPKLLTIIRLVGGGLSNKEIATATGITPGTVKVYMSLKIFPALRLDSRLQVANWARDNAELLQDPSEEQQQDCAVLIEALQSAKSMQQVRQAMKQHERTCPNCNAKLRKPATEDVHNPAA